MPVLSYNESTKGHAFGQSQRLIEMPCWKLFDWNKEIFMSVLSSYKTKEPLINSAFVPNLYKFFDFERSSFQ